MNRLLLLFLSGLVSSPVLAAEPDTRQVLALTAPQRAHVLEEMRGLLAGTQHILDALSRDDMAVVAQHANALGMSMAHKAEDHLKGALPKPFMQLGMSVHQDFDLIASDAEALKDPRHTLRQLSHTMQRCVACHAAYQIRPVGQTQKHPEQTGHHSHH